MSLFMIISLAIGLAMDAMAVAIGVSISLRDVTKSQILRLSLHFGVFQAVMPILGWLSGYYAAHWMALFSHYIAFALLAFIGARAVVDALRERTRSERIVRDPTRGASLVLLSLATSLDAFAVGVSFAMLNIQVWYPAIVIGLVAGLLTVAGMVFGSRLGRRFGTTVEIIGGLILILIGVKVLWDGL